MGRGRQFPCAISIREQQRALLLEPADGKETLVKDVCAGAATGTQRSISRPRRPATRRRVIAIGLDPTQSPSETLKGLTSWFRGLNPRENRPLAFYHKNKNLGF